MYIYTFCNIYNIMEYLNKSSEGLTTLDVSNNTELESLYCRYNPNLKQIIISKGQKIEIYKDEHTKIIEI